MSKIVHHEDWQKVPFVAFLNTHLRRNGLPPAPPLDSVAGSVPAIVNQGRWIVECATAGCGGAVVASEKAPYFFCPYCGNEGNGGKWLEVKFPKEKEKIEAELLKRPARRDFEAHFRNWRPGEFMKELQDENERMGI